MDDNSRNVINFASNVSGMKLCWNDQANATHATATIVLRLKRLKSRNQIAVIGHLLGQSPNERPRQHAIERGHQRQMSKNERRRKRAIHDPAGAIDAAENERQARRNKCHAEHRIAQEAGLFKAD